MKEKKISRSEALMDSLYQNRVQYFKYFAAVLITTILREVGNAFLKSIANSPSTGVISWCLWAVIFFFALKFFVFKYRAPEIFTLLKVCMIYIFAVAVLWFTRSFFISIILAFSKNSTVAMSIGGALNEILCLFIMFSFVFNKKTTK